MNEDKWIRSTLTIARQEIETRGGMMRQADLKFYTENPRIYSLIRREHETPTQWDIYKTLKELDHVKQLVQSIRVHGGLMEPLLVRDGNFDVLEGNSRLAAYRSLAEIEPVKWGKCKVTILPEDIDEKLIFALLGELHIVGRKDWQPFEQAGYLYRRIEQHNASPSEIAGEMGISTRTVNRLVEVYRFMVENNEEDPARWSYYEEYLRPKVARDARLRHRALDAHVVAKIRSGEIARAVDVRDKLMRVLKGGDRSIKILMSGEETLERALISAADRGVDNPWLNRLASFRRQLVAETTPAEFAEMKPDHRKKARFEVTKIERQLKRLRPKLE